MTAIAAGVSEAERLARATISLVAEPGEIAFTGLVEQRGGVAALELISSHGSVHDEYAAAVTRLPDVDAARELERAARLGIRFVVPGDPEWPRQLDDLGSAGMLQQRGGPPVGLWARGPLRLDELAGSVAIVGSRSSTSYGEKVAGDLAAELGLAHHPVVSGAAFGIDQASHRGAISVDAPTAAVLACGVDKVYPEAHRRMLTYLGAHHAVISEAPPGAAPHRIRFLARNRLIAALTVGTIVVEAAARSGALNTVNWAQRLNRVVMGVPGPVTSATSEGVHHQIRRGGAALVTCGKDVLELLGSAGENLVDDPRGPATARDHLSLRERQLLDAVPVHAASDTAKVAKVAGLGVLQTERALQRLRESGLVQSEGAGWRLTDRARG